MARVGLSWVACKQERPRKYVFGVTSIGQGSSPWTWNAVKVEINFTSSANSIFLVHNLGCIWKYRGYVLSFLAKLWRLTSVNTNYMKTALNSSFCAVTSVSKSRWPHGKKAYFRGVRAGSPGRAGAGALRSAPVPRASPTESLRAGYECAKQCDWRRLFNTNMSHN